MNKISIELRPWDFVEGRVEAEGVVEVLALVAHERQVVLVGVLGVAHLAGALLAFDNGFVVQALLARRAVLACKEWQKLLFASPLPNILHLHC